MARMNKIDPIRLKTSLEIRGLRADKVSESIGYERQVLYRSMQNHRISTPMALLLDYAYGIPRTEYFIGEIKVYRARKPKELALKELYDTVFDAVRKATETV